MSCMNRVLVIGATGTIGPTSFLSIGGERVYVRAMTRTRKRLGCRATQVEVMRGDLTVPHTLDGCLHGIDTVFLVWTAPPAAVVPALGLIARHTRRIVLLSAPIKTPHPFFQQSNPAPSRSGAD